MPKGASPEGPSACPDATGSGMAEPSRPVVFPLDLLQYSDVQSAAPAANEGGLDEDGVEGCDDSAVGGEAMEEEREGKMDPRTRLALSREASFLTSMRNLDGFMSVFGAGGEFRSTARWRADRRVICIELGRRCLGRHNGPGNLGGCE